MKALLLGATGQLGRDIMRAHKQAGEPFALSPLPRERLDLTAPEAAAQALDNLEFDALVNCAACHNTDEVEDNANLAFAVNAHAVGVLARACAKRGARFIHISTDYVFGGDKGRAQPLREDDPVAPVNVYGASKALGENLARLEGGDVVILRVASLFGVAGANDKGGNFVETMIRLGREKETLRVVDDQIMSPTATADAAAAILRILTRGCPAGTYHAVNGGAVSWFEFAQAILRGVKASGTVTPCSSGDYPTRALRPRYTALDNAKFAAAVGPMPTWQDALGRYLQARNGAAEERGP